MTDATFRRVALDLHEEGLLPLPGLPEGEGRDRVLASFLREVFTEPGGRLAACAGAVLLDEDGRPRALTAPFAGEWPRADVQALELFATARKAGWPRLVLFRCESSSHALPNSSLRFAQDMRALGLLFAVEVVDLLIVRPGRYWALSKVPILAASLDCEVTLNRCLDYLIACGFERSLPPLKIEESAENGVPLRVETLVEPRREPTLDGFPV